VSVELPPRGRRFPPGKPIGLVESTTTVFELLSPLSGFVVALNRKRRSPAEGDGGSVRRGVAAVDPPADREELDALLSAEEYARFAGKR